MKIILKSHEKITKKNKQKKNKNKTKVFRIFNLYLFLPTFISFIFGCIIFFLHLLA